MPKYTGPPTPWTYLQDEKKYTWMKSPRYDGRAMEVGPLARMLVGYAAGHEGHQGDRRRTLLDRLDVPPAALFSTLGRVGGALHGDGPAWPTRCRTGTASWWPASRTATPRPSTATSGSPSTWPKTAQGYGYLDAARGALGHWVQIEDGKISRYQCVVPSTWNCSPRDEQGVPGPYEAALMDNHPLLRPGAAARDPAHHPLLRPLHVLRRPRARRRRAFGRGGQGPMTVPTPRHGPAPPPMADSPLFPLGARFAPPSGNYRWVEPWGAPAARHALDRGARHPRADRDRVLHRAPLLHDHRRAAPVPHGVHPAHPLRGRRRVRHDRPGPGRTGSSPATSSSGSPRSSRSGSATGSTSSRRSSTT